MGDDVIALLCHHPTRVEADISLTLVGRQHRLDGAMDFRSNTCNVTKAARWRQATS